MKKNLITLATVASFAFFASSASATGMLPPANPGHSYKPSPEFNMTGQVNGWTEGGAAALGSGNGPGQHETFSTGTSEGWVSMESSQTQYAPGTDCAATGCGDNFATINAGFAGNHKSGAFSANSGDDHAVSTAATVSSVGFNGKTDIDMVPDHNHHNHDHHDQD